MAEQNSILDVAVTQIDQRTLNCSGPTCVKESNHLRTKSWSAPDQYKRTDCGNMYAEEALITPDRQQCETFNIG